MKPALPTAVFENLIAIHPGMVSKRHLVVQDDVFQYGGARIEYAWLECAMQYSSKSGNPLSMPQYHDHVESLPNRSYIGAYLVEVLSVNEHHILMLNSFPVGQLDRKGKYIMVMTFKYPVMSVEEKEKFELLSAANSCYEFIELAKDRHHLNYVMQEEGMVNSLRFIRSVCLENSEVQLLIEVDHSTISEKPTWDNIIDWIGVRKGETHLAELKRRK